MADFFALKEDGGRIITEAGDGYVLLEASDTEDDFWTDVDYDAGAGWTVI